MVFSNPILFFSEDKIFKGGPAFLFMRQIYFSKKPLLRKFSKGPSPSLLCRGVRYRAFQLLIWLFSTWWRNYVKKCASARPWKWFKLITSKQRPFSACCIVGINQSQGVHSNPFIIVFPSVIHKNNEWIMKREHCT